MTLFTLFEKAVKSRLGASNTLTLNPYGPDDLVRIARQRYEASCRPARFFRWRLNKIGSFASDAGGDARMALELLEAAIRRLRRMEGTRLLRAMYI